MCIRDSFCMIVRQPLCAAVGMTQASSVIRVVSASELELLTSTRSLTPSKLSAVPYLPATTQVAPPLIVPVLPLPEASATVVPAVSYTHLRAHETPEHLVCRL